MKLAESSHRLAHALRAVTRAVLMCRRARKNYILSGVFNCKFPRKITKYCRVYLTVYFPEKKLNIIGCIKL